MHSCTLFNASIVDSVFDFFRVAVGESMRLSESFDSVSLNLTRESYGNDSMAFHFYRSGPSNLCHLTERLVDALKTLNQSQPAHHFGVLAEAQHKMLGRRLNGDDLYLQLISKDLRGNTFQSQESSACYCSSGTSYFGQVNELSTYLYAEPENAPFFRQAVHTILTGVEQRNSWSREVVLKSSNLHAVIIVRKQNRMIVNLKQVVSTLMDLGVQVSLAQLELLDIASQIETIASASILIGVHGQGMTLSYFVRPEALVIEYVPYTGKWSPVGGEYTAAGQALNHRFYTQVDVPWKRTVYGSKYLQANKTAFDLMMKKKKRRGKNRWRAVLYHVDIVVNIKSLKDIVTKWIKETS
jgi:hypothetical protein